MKLAQAALVLLPVPTNVPSVASAPVMAMAGNNAAIMIQTLVWTGAV
jgi:hypothetical protein